MSTTTVRADPRPAVAGHPLRRFALGAILLAEIMDLLDTTIVNVAAPSIRHALGGGDSQIQWVSAAYTLAFAMLLITGARLGDLVGRKRMFLLGTVGFTLCSALCAASDGAGMLIGARACQGAFAALVIPQGLGIIRAVFPAEEMGQAFGAFGPVLGLSSVLGPTLGGLLVGSDLWGTGWRMIFLINLPVGLAATLLGARAIPADHGTAGARRLDLPGVAVLSAAMVLLVYPLIQGRELGWPAWTFASMALSLPLFAGFAALQRRRAGTGRAPLVEPGLFRGRAFRSAIVVVALFSAAMSGLMLTFTLTLQLGAHWTPLHAGLTFVPMSVGIVAGAVASGAVLGARFGRRVIHAGVVVMVLGVLGLWASLGHWGLTVTTWELLPALLVSGVGMGLLMGPLFDIALAGVAEEESGSASGVLNALQQLGGSVGVAALGTAFLSWAPTHGPVTAAGWTLAATALVLGLVGLAAFALPRMPRAEQQH
ncbi:MFS transporter [Streptacidiphilus jiangxiensis]|uniref:Drug resistance transporter, EmrB/QacA subfamily n=1 Tax=Streptacidiphilus jiangxiensis TaxID=235985 RepID=A0A1H7U5N5_STRJI|nr:MFS transporter [Streptacidiphilus jiangxiensis]SEL92065.1 drug resistance transporter, EmrB/QacA subfamily [Streptacidiphilus jiangxiensis]